MATPGGRNQVGTVYVVVRGITKDVKKDVLKSFKSAFKDVEKESSKSGVIAGRKWAAGFNLGIKSSNLQTSISRAWRDIEREAEHSGRRAGERYAAAYNAAIKRSTRRSRPQMDQESRAATRRQNVVTNNRDDSAARRQRQEQARAAAEQDRQERAAARQERIRRTNEPATKGNERRTVTTVFKSVGDKVLKATLGAILGMLRGIAIAAAAAMAALGGQAALAGLANIIASLSQISGLLLTLPAAANAFALVLGTMKVGLSGIGSALQAGAQAQKQAGQNAKAQEQAITSAQRGITSAIRQREAAERGVESAQRNRIRVQQDYSRAIQDATRQLEDFNLQLKGAALDEEDALIAVERAKERLANMPSDSTALDWREARNSLKKAKLSLEETRVSNKRLGEDSKEAFKKGVKGADSVVDAAQAVKDADQQLIDAQQNLADSNQALADAQKALTDAMNGSAGGVDAFAEAMKNLSPSAQAMVKTLLSLKERFSDIKKNVQENLMSGLAEQVDALATKYFPVLDRVMGRMATTLNGIGKDLIAVFSTSSAVANFELVMTRVNGMMEKLRPAFASLAQVWMNLSIVGSEFLGRFGDGITSSAKKLEDWSADFDNIRTIIENAITAIKQWWAILKNLGAVIKEVFSAANNAEFMQSLVDATARFREFIELPSTRNTMVEFFDRGRDAMVAIEPVLENLTLGAISLGGMLARLGTLISPGVADFFSGLTAGIDNLRPAIEIIGPKISELLSALGGNLPQLGSTIGSLLVAMSPWIDVMTILSRTLLPVILKLLEALAPVLSAMAPVIVGVAIAWKGLSTAAAASNAIMGVANALMGKQAAAAARSTLLLKIKTGVMKAASVASRGLGLAMKFMLGPTGLIIAAVAAVVVGLILLYKKNETFRKFIDSTWKNIKVAISIVWEWIKNVLWPGIKAVFESLGKIVMWLWNNVMQPAWTGIKAVIGLWWTGVKVYFSAVMTVIRGIGAIVMWLWNNIIKPAWEGIKIAIEVAWNLIKPIFEGIKAGFKAVGAVFNWIWENILRPVWDFIKRKFEEGKVVVGIVIDEIKKRFENFKENIGKVKDWIVEKFTAVVDFFKGLPGKIADATKDLWNGIKDSFRNALNWIIDKWNNFKIPAVKISGVQVSPEVNFPDLPRFSSGGLLKGPGTGTSDSILGLSQTGAPTARVSNGEFVVNEKATRRFLPLLELMNKLPGLKLGGLVGAIRGYAAGGEVAGGPAKTAGSTQAPSGPMDLLGNINGLGNVFSGVGAVFNNVWATVIKPVIDSFGLSIKNFVDGVARPAISALTAGFSGFGELFSGIVVGTLQPMWNNFGATIQDVVNGVVNTALETLKAALTGVQNFFGTTVQGIQKLWDGLRRATGEPINWVINSAYNNGLTKVWNDIASLVGMDGKKLNNIAPLSFATGGVLPGYTPGRDVHHFTSPTGGRLNLSGGEAIMRPEFTRAVGGPAGVNRLNAQAKNGRLRNSQGEGNYAEGGVIGSYGLPGGSSIYYGGGGFPQWVYRLGRSHGVQASTYPGHQESNRGEAGYAPNPQGLNRGIDWAGPIPAMQRFAEYLFSVAPKTPTLEQIIWQNPGTGQKIGWYGRSPDVGGSYFASDYGGHTDHVHTRQNGPIIPGIPGDSRILGALLGGAVTVPSIVDMVSDSFKLFDKAMSGAPKSGGPFTAGAVSVAKKAGEELKKFAEKKAKEIDATTGAVTMGALGGGAEKNAREIIKSAKSRSLGKEGSSIGIATGIVESGLRVLANPAVPESLKMPNEGLGYDHDSVGIFQQRQAGWGTLAQRMNPRASADLFFNAMLSKFPNWRQMDPGAVAQGVQASASQDKYGKVMGQARGMVEKLYDSGGWLPRGKRIVNNQTGKPEAILTNAQWNVIRRNIEQVENVKDEQEEKEKEKENTDSSSVEKSEDETTEDKDKSTDDTTTSPKIDRSDPNNPKVIDPSIKEPKTDDKAADDQAEGKTKNRLKSEDSEKKATPKLELWGGSGSYSGRVGYAAGSALQFGIDKLFTDTNGFGGIFGKYDNTGTSLGSRFGGALNTAVTGQLDSALDLVGLAGGESTAMTIFDEIHKINSAGQTDLESAKAENDSTSTTTSEEKKKSTTTTEIRKAPSDDPMKNMARMVEAAFAAGSVSVTINGNADADKVVSKIEQARRRKMNRYMR